MDASILFSRPYSSSIIDLDHRSCYEIFINIVLVFARACTTAFYDIHLPLYNHTDWRFQVGYSHITEIKGKLVKRSILKRFDYNWENVEYLSLENNEKL